MALSLREISKSFHKNGHAVRAVDQVSLDVNAGEFVAVQGPSGCGKTTLLLMASGLLRPDTGSVLWEGQEVYSMSPNERAAFRGQNIGYVFQQFHLVPYLSILENVLTPSMAAKTSDPRRRALELIDQLGLTSRVSHRPSELSSGERQRAALARALLNEPKILFADEPTGNLDAGNGVQVLEALRSYVGRGKSVLLVTHDPAARAFADRMIELKAGSRVNYSSQIGTGP